MPSALNILSKHERASYCNRYWEHQFKKVYADANILVLINMMITVSITYQTVLY